jgi:hypothetical protein
VRRVTYLVLRATDANAQLVCERNYLETQTDAMLVRDGAAELAEILARRAQPSPGNDAGRRVGYRWVPKPVFFGFGLSASNTLGVSGVPEAGIRFLIGMLAAAPRRAPSLGHEVRKEIDSG